MFYLLLLVLLALIYWFLMPKDIKQFLNIFVLLGGITLFVTIVLGLVFRYHYSLIELLFYFAAIILVVMGVREIEKL